MSGHPLLQAQIEAEETGHLGYARFLTEQHLREQPLHLPAMLAYAHHQIAFGQYADAQRMLAKAHAQAEGSQIALVCLQEGHLLHAQGQFAAAEVTYLAAQELEPDDAHGFTFAAASAFQRGDLARALELGQLASRCREGCLDEAWADLAGYYLAVRRLDEAEECCQLAHAVDPESGATHTLADDLELMRQFGHSPPLLDSEAAIDALVQEAFGAEAAGHIGYARCLAEHVLRDHPHHPQALSILVLTQTAFCQYAEALAAIDHLEAHMKASDRPKILLLRGQLLTRQGRHEAAVTTYLESHGQQPDDATPLVFAASAAFDDGNLDLAQTLAARATECPEGELDEAWHNLGGYLLSARHYEEAAECYRRALEIDPGNVFALRRQQDVELILSSLGR
ncbi:MAG: tetratricopeptide repeat protein [Verrucomicrobia bacterium]|nr:tetratricopeptide repeat protein [Verrucomicrobiota bacterium]